MNNFKEKRKQKRHDLVWNIYKKNGELTKHLGYVKNFSESGIFFASKYEFKPETELTIRITVPEKLFSKIKTIYLEIKIKIIRQESSNNSIYFVNYGAKFENVEKQKQDDIETFLKYWQNNLNGKNSEK